MVHYIAGSPRTYSWGSTNALQELTGRGVPGQPLAELWYGAHPTAPSLVREDGPRLDALISAEPRHILGDDVIERFGPGLPYLLKLIAPAAALSLQVHPSVEKARERFTREDREGIPLTAPHRNYKDSNHKPELVYALTQFEAMCGFRAPRRAAELLDGLFTSITDTLYAHLRADANAHGVKAAFTSLFLSPPSADEVAIVASACAHRLERGSPSPRTDATVVALQREHPGDPGVVAPLLLNPVSLRPGESLFVPAGGVHAYLSGVGVELMASSDNVLRAGLTSKHVDIPEMLSCVDYVAAPPVRIAPEVADDELTEVFYAPVDDFQLTVAHLVPVPRRVRGGGPRILLSVGGEAVVRVPGAPAPQYVLLPGEGLLLTADDAEPEVWGDGRLVQAGVP